MQISLLVLAVVSPLQAQERSPRGLDFWLAFPEQPINLQAPEFRLHLSSKRTVSVTVEIPRARWSTTVQVQAGQAAEVGVPFNLAHAAGSENLQNKGVHIQASDSISVFAEVSSPEVYEGFTVYPTHTLRDDYRVLSYANPAVSPSPVRSQFILVGVQDSTVVEITPSNRTQGGRPAGTPFTITLGRGQAYPVQILTDAANPADASGTRIRTTNGACPQVAVIAGAPCAQVGTAAAGANQPCTPCNSLLMQTPPLVSWGKNYRAVGDADRNQTLLKVLAHENGTQLTYVLDGGPQQTQNLQAGQSTLLPYSQAAQLTASKAVLAAQLSPGASCHGPSRAGASLRWLPPLRQALRTPYRLQVPTSWVDSGRVQLLSPTSDTGLVRLNGQPPTGWNMLNADTTWAWLEAPLSTWGPGPLVLEADSGLLAHLRVTNNRRTLSIPLGANWENLRLQLGLRPGDYRPLCAGNALDVSFDFPDPNARLIINWGDGNVNQNSRGAETHTYNSPGAYRLVFAARNPAVCGLNRSDSVVRWLRVRVPEYDLQVSPVPCAGGSTGSILVQPRSSFTPYRYSLDGGPTTLDSLFPNLPVGNYQLLVLDSFNCSASEQVAITDPPPLTWAGLQTENIACRGDSTGQIRASNQGGVPPYRFRLASRPQDTGPIFDSLAAATYLLSVEDNNGCRLDTTLTLTQPDKALQLDSLVVDSVSCTGRKDGQVQFYLSGGAPPYQTRVGPGSLATQVAWNRLRPGPYTWRVQDANGCQLAGQVVVPHITGLVLSGLRVDSIRCAGSANGSITVLGSGQGPLRYGFDLASAGPSNRLISLGPGVYRPRIIDRFGCWLDTTVVLSQPPPLQWSSLDTGQNQCPGDATGSIRTTAFGGRPPLVYQLNNRAPQPTGVFTQLQAGRYQVQVVDSSACRLDTLLDLPQADSIRMPTDTLVCSGQADFAVLHPTPPGGVWLNNSVTSERSDTVLLELPPPGKYSLRYRDPRGCEAAFNLTVNPKPDLQANLAPQPSLLTLPDSAALRVEAFGSRLDSLRWLVNDSLFAQTEAPNAQQLQFEREQEVSLRLLGVNRYGCRDTLEAGPWLVRRPTRVLIPNAFSPNGDNTNDRWLVWAPNAQALLLEVFNRLGERVFRTEQARSPVTWNGRLESGEPAPEGVYTYRLVGTGLQGEPFNHLGTVTLIR